MKTLKIYKREISERPGFSRFRIRKVTQYVVLYDGSEYRNQHQEDFDNYKLRIRFVEVLNTRKSRSLDSFLMKLTNTDSDKWLKHTLETFVKKIRIQ